MSDTIDLKPAAAPQPAAPPAAAPAPSSREFLPPDSARAKQTAEQLNAGQPFGFDYPATQVGVTGNITVSYDPALGASGLALAQNLLKVVLAPYQQMQSIFGITGGPVTVIVAPLSGKNDGSGGAYHYGCDFTSGGVMYVDATFSNTVSNPLDLEVGLYIAELSETFMGAQNHGWGCGYSNGEGLSRFCGENSPPGLLPAWGISAPSWVSAGYPDWVTKTEQTDRDYTSIGCSILYIYWMRSQGFTVSQIVQAAGTTLAANYKTLTGKATALADLTAAAKALTIKTDNPFFERLYQMHGDGTIWAYNGTPLTGWQLLDNNPRARAICASGPHLYQLHDDGTIWVYTGPPITGWQILDNNVRTRAIAASGASLYQLHSDGTIWRYTGTPLTGWQMLDNNPATCAIVAADRLYQLHHDGTIWVYTGTPLTGWQMLDNNPATISIASAAGVLYQLHNDGSIWVYTGTPLSGWQMLDNNPAAVAIVAGSNGLYQMHGDGSIWFYTGPPLTGWLKLDNNPRARAIAAAEGLYQFHGDGSLWRYTGTPLSGWQQLDNNPATTGMAVAY
jgi:hypothetical protein